MTPKGAIPLEFNTPIGLLLELSSENLERTVEREKFDDARKPRKRSASLRCPKFFARRPLTAENIKILTCLSDKRFKPYISSLLLVQCSTRGSRLKQPTVNY